MAVAGQPELARQQRLATAARRAGAIAMRLHLPLVAIYAVAGSVAIHYATDVDTWKVMTDELQYVRVALSFEEDTTLLPYIHGDYYGVYNLVYPWLIAPLYALFDAPEAFRAAHVLNALVMASAVFPAYLIARGAGLSRWVSYLAGALTVAVPWLTFTTLLFTEVAAYPAFLWAVAGMQRALNIPGLRSDLLAMAGLLLAFGARTQFIVIAPLLPLAIVIHELGIRVHERPRQTPRGIVAATARAVWAGHRTLLVGFALALLATLFVVPGGVPGLLGSYAETARGDILPPGIFLGSGLNLVLTGLAVGLVPVILAAAWTISALVRFPGRREHALAVLLLLLVLAVTVSATSYNLRYQLGFSHERYLFYIAPLLLIGMLACLAGRLRPWVAVLIAGGAVLWRLDSADLSPRDPPLFASPAQFFYRVLDGRVYDLGRNLGFDNLSQETVIMIGGAIATIALAFAVRSLPKRTVTAVVGLAVLAYGAVETRYLFPRAAEAGTGGPMSARIPLMERDWIDDNVPAGADVALVPGTVLGDEFTSRVVWWTTELFNKRATEVLAYPGSSTYSNWSSRPLELDERSGQLETPTEYRYLVVPSDYVRFRPAARRTFTHPSALLTGAEVERPYRVDWASFGVDTDYWTIANPRVRFYADPRRETTERRVELTLDLPQLAARRRYRLTGGTTVVGGVIAGGQIRRAVVCVSIPRVQARDLRISVPRTPSGDGRRVGVKLTAIRELPLPRGGCERPAA